MIRYLRLLVYLNGFLWGKCLTLTVARGALGILIKLM